MEHIDIMIDGCNMPTARYMQELTWLLNVVQKYATLTLFLDITS